MKCRDLTRSSTLLVVTGIRGAVGGTAVVGCTAAKLGVWGLPEVETAALLPSGGGNAVEEEAGVDTRSG